MANGSEKVLWCCCCVVTRRSLGFLNAVGGSLDHSRPPGTRHVTAAQPYRQAYALIAVICQERKSCHSFMSYAYLEENGMSI